MYPNNKWIWFIGLFRNNWASCNPLINFEKCRWDLSGTCLHKNTQSVFFYYHFFSSYFFMVWRLSIWICLYSILISSYLRILIKFGKTGSEIIRSLLWKFHFTHKKIHYINYSFFVLPISGLVYTPGVLVLYLVGLVYN